MRPRAALTRSARDMADPPPPALLDEDAQEEELPAPSSGLPPLRRRALPQDPSDESGEQGMRIDQISSGKSEPGFEHVNSSVWDSKEGEWDKDLNGEGSRLAQQEESSAQASASQTQSQSQLPSQSLPQNLIPPPSQSPSQTMTMATGRTYPAFLTDQQKEELDWIMRTFMGGPSEYEHIMYLHTGTLTPSAPSLAGTSEGSLGNSGTVPLWLRPGLIRATSATATAAAEGASLSRGPGEARQAWEVSEAKWRALGPDGLKDEGNACYKAQKLREAIVWYSRGIVLASKDHVLYSNRCAAMYELHKRTEGSNASDTDAEEQRNLLDMILCDALVCIVIKPTWDRGHYRLGLALEAKGEMADAQVSFANALRCNPGNTDAKARLAASMRSIGRACENKATMPSIDDPRRGAFEKAMRKAMANFSARNRKDLSWAEAALRREQGLRQEQQHREPAEAQRQGAGTQREGARKRRERARKRRQGARTQREGAQEQKHEEVSQEGAVTVAPDARAAAAGAASGKKAMATDQGEMLTAVMAPLPAKTWSSWAAGKTPPQAAQWLIDCFRLRETADWLGPNAHFHDDDCSKLATLPLLKFCKLALCKKVLPHHWNWEAFFSMCFDRNSKSKSKFSVLRKLSRVGAEKQHSARVVGTSFDASELSMIAVAAYIVGCKTGDAWPSDSLVVCDEVSVGFYRWLQGRGAIAKHRGDGGRREGKSTTDAHGQVQLGGGKYTDVFQDVGAEPGWAEVYRKDTEDPKPCQCKCCWEEDMLHLLDEFYGGA